MAEKLTPVSDPRPPDAKVEPVRSAEQRKHAAMTLAWALYLSRLNDLVANQHASWSKGQPTTHLTMAPPSSQWVDLIAEALAQAESLGVAQSIGKALEPVIRLCDTMDNTDRRKKNETFKWFRGEVEDVYNELHRLRSAASVTQ